MTTKATSFLVTIAMLTALAIEALAQAQTQPDDEQEPMGIFVVFEGETVKCKAIPVPSNSPAAFVDDIGMPDWRDVVETLARATGTIASELFIHGWPTLRALLDDLFLALDGNDSAANGMLRTLLGACLIQTVEQAPPANP